ncbi:hypothetical protein ABT084_09765 [Streptomyces sp. NPDC002138]|uniref:hypothetical protein n=1 Tax=Streptomyces sp. NPDC002138 TaxID=3154410 RepID=UPI00332E2B74
MTDRARFAPRASRWSRVPLLAALLLGIVTMHTLGHPDDSPAGQDAPPAHTVAHAMPAARQAHEPAEARQDHGAADAGQAHEPADAPRAAGVPPSPGRAAVRGPGGGMAMDPMSVCLAVLLAGVTLLSVLTLARTAADAAARRPAAPGGRARGGPDPPTARELLDRLTVLRV